jgi:hypothetical protein
MSPQPAVFDLTDNRPRLLQSLLMTLGPLQQQATELGEGGPEPISQRLGASWPTGASAANSRR